MRKNLVNSKGQMQLSFGMIFSIILIATFLAFAIYGIVKFLGIQKQAKAASFFADLQDDLNTVWKSPEATKPVEYFQPSEIAQVCFVKDNYNNVVFNPLNAVSGVNAPMIEHLDIPSTIGNSDQLCINAVSGKISFILKKDFGENLVTVKKA